MEQEDRFPCDFGNFFACDRGTTPQELVQRGIYGPIATPLRGGAWRAASMIMLAKGISASAGDAEATAPASKQGPRAKLLSWGTAKLATKRNTKAAVVTFAAPSSVTVDMLPLDVDTPRELLPPPPPRTSSRCTSSC